MQDNSKTILTFLIGAAAGVAIGYFLASDDKEEIIDDIKSTASKVRKNLENEIEKGKQLVDEMKNKFSDLFQNA